MHKRGSIMGGILLIMAGSLFLALELFPDLASQLNISQQWPLIIVGLGGLFLFSAIGNPSLAIPGSVLGGIGLLLYYQNLTDNWGSWAYAWTLLPGFTGIGTLLENLLKGKLRRGIREGGRLIVTSLMLFAVFGSFLGGWSSLDKVWPVLLILLGISLLLKNVFRGRRTSTKKSSIKTH